MPGADHSSERLPRRAGRPPRRLDPTASAAAFLGYELRRLRQERQVTLAVLATATGYSTQHAGAVERGTATASEQFLRACDRALSTSGYLSSLLPAVIREQTATRHGRAAARRTQGDDGEQSNPEIQPNQQLLHQDDTDAAASDLDWERLAALHQGRSLPSPRTLSDLELITDRHRALYHELTWSEMLAPVEAHLGLLSALLHRPAPEPLQRRLASATAETAGLAAWLQFESGNVAVAADRYVVADSASAQFGDVGLAAYVRGFRAQITARVGDRRAYAQQTEIAVRQANRAADRLTKAWLSALRAHALATNGDRTGAVGALRSAENAMERSRPDSAAPWMYEFDQGRLSGYRGSCYLLLDLPREAATALEESLQALPASCTRRQAELRVDLALAHLATGGVDDSLHFGLRAADGFLTRGSVPGLRRVANLRDRLTDAGHTHAARAIDERLRGHE
jgi:transcriptional regulator with XRE-family HTH domain